MEWNRAELEEQFARDRKSHKRSVWLGRSAILFGCIAVVACGPVGVMSALKGNIGTAFTDIALCLLNIVLVWQNIKRHREEVRCWKQYEASHTDLMENWDEVKAYWEELTNEQKP